MRLGFSLEAFGHTFHADVRRKVQRFGYGVETIGGVELEVGSPEWRAAVKAQHDAERAVAHADVERLQLALDAGRELAARCDETMKQAQEESDRARATRDVYEHQLGQLAVGKKAAGNVKEGN